MSIYYISPELTKLFRPKEGKNLVSAINSRMNLTFVAANNAVHVEDIIEINNVGNMINE